MAIGGGDEIGASCYYLQIEDTRIILDLGIRDRGCKLPDLNVLIDSAMIRSMKDINTIIISHAHPDHYKGLRYLETNINDLRIVATPQTKQRLLATVNKKNYTLEREFLRVKQYMCSILEYSYFQDFYIGHIKATFIPAGHTEGAAMSLIETSGHKILYTGDFSFPLNKYAKEKNDKEILRVMGLCDVLIVESTYGYTDAINLNTKNHASYKQLIWFMKQITPKYIFLVHQNTQQVDKEFVDQIKKELPNTEVIKVVNKEVYEVEMV